MPLIFNGTTIPEDGDNLVYNGTNLESVVFNGVEVWKKVVFKALWSGDSVCGFGSGILGFQTSGSNIRFKDSNSSYQWATVGTDGVFSSTFSGNGSFNYRFLAFGGANGTNSKSFGMGITGGDVWQKVGVTLSTVLGFSGSSISSGKGITTSSSLVRAISDGKVGSWVSIS